jgi:hypothetical protein
LPSAALGKAASAKIRSAKPSLPRASVALGNEKAPLTSPQHLPSLPRAHLAGSRQIVFLFSEKLFAESQSSHALGKRFPFLKKSLPRVLLAWLSAKYFSFF